MELDHAGSGCSRFLFSTWQVVYVKSYPSLKIFRDRTNPGGHQSGR